jgi:hypothetical protein
MVETVVNAVKQNPKSLLSPFEFLRGLAEMPGIRNSLSVVQGCERLKPQRVV